MLSFQSSPSREWTEGLGDSGENLHELIEDPDASAKEVILHRRFLSWRFVGYLAGCLLVTLTSSVASVALWSDMGCQRACLAFLEEHQGYAWYCIGVLLLLGLVLYVLDFFLPPHLPGRHFQFAEGGKTLGRYFLAVAGAAFLAGCFLSAKDYPTLPLVVTITLSPLSLIFLRRLTMPTLPERPTHGNQKDLTGRISLLKLLTWEERDEKNFYSAATYSFVLAALACLAAWIPWALSHEPTFESQMSASDGNDAKELLFVRWATPVIVAISNVVFAGFACLRVTLNRAYSATDEIKNQLILDAKAAMNRQLMHYRIATLRARLAASQGQRDVLQTTEDRLQQYLVQHISHMRMLSSIVKSVLFTFAVLMGVLHIVFLVSPASHIGIMVQGLVGSFLLTFILFIFVSFNRLSRSMSMALLDLPFWTSVSSAGQADWARGLLLSLLLPIVPLVLLLSATNQLVRRCRGLTDSGQLLTQRTQALLSSVAEWNWVRTVYWSYIWAGVLMLYRVTPVVLNVLLAWMTSMMEDLNFTMVLAATFLSGVFLFMLPPVPGPAIYPFAGLIISKSCPYGFWWGCIICIALSFLLKLAACAVQQKLIGELLGSNLSVRRTCGVHKPFIRALENILRRPGMSYGKCMVLCGGPDWPTSVIAGILRLSLFQCLLGTIPIIASIIPLVLTGSFYLKRGEGDVWLRTGNLMLTITALVSAVFWVGIGWAVQAEYDQHGDEISRPKEEFLELEWLDFRAAYVAKRCESAWRDVPRGLRVPYLGGAVFATLVGHAFLWRSSNCFGSFSVTDDISTLQWFGRDGLIRPSGAMGLVAGIVSYMGLVAYNCWHRRRHAASMSEAQADLRSMETSWKEQWLEKLRAPRSWHLSSDSNEAIAEEEALDELQVPRSKSAQEILEKTFALPVPKRVRSAVLLGAETAEELKVYGRSGSSSWSGVAECKAERKPGLVELPAQFLESDGVMSI